MKKLIVALIAVIFAFQANAKLKVYGETINESSTTTITGIISSRVSSGSITYYPSEKRLVFSNVRIDSETIGGPLIDTDVSGLTIEFVGTSNITMPFMFLYSESDKITIKGQGRTSSKLFFCRKISSSTESCAGIMARCPNADITIKDLHIELDTEWGVYSIRCDNNSTTTLTLDGVEGKFAGKSESSSGGALSSSISRLGNIIFRNCAIDPEQGLIYDNDFFLDAHGDVVNATTGEKFQGAVRIVYGATAPTIYPLHYKGVRVSSISAANLNGKGTVSYDAFNNRILISLSETEHLGNNTVIDYFGTEAFSVRFAGNNKFYSAENFEKQYFLRSRIDGVPCTISGECEDDVLYVELYNGIVADGPLYIRNGTYTFLSKVDKTIIGDSEYYFQVTDANLAVYCRSTGPVSGFKGLNLSGCAVSYPYFDWHTSLSGEKSYIQIAIPHLANYCNLENISGSTLTSNSFTVNLQMVNQGENAYYGKVKMKVYKVGGGSEVYAETVMDSQINKGKTGEYLLSCDGLEYGNTYYARLYYTCANDDVLIGTSDSYELPVPGFESYNVKVNGTVLTTENCQKDGVVEGVSYNNATKTLTMDNVAFTKSSSTTFIYTTDDITVRLIGDNTVRGMNFLSAANGASVTLDGGGTATLTSVGYTSGSQCTFSFIYGGDCTIRDMANISVTCPSGTATCPFRGKSGETTLKLINSTGEFIKQSSYANNVVQQLKKLEIENVNLTNDTYSETKTTYGYRGQFTFERTGFLLGDIDRNGILEVNDVVLLADIAMGGSMGDVQMSIADMDGNGLIEVNDVVILAGLVMGS